MTTRQLRTIEYVLRHLFWGALLYLIYSSTLFVGLPGFTAGRSRLVLLAMIGAFTLLGVGLTPAKMRTEVRAGVDVLLAVEVYEAIARFAQSRWIVLGLAGLAAILSAGVWITAFAEREEAPARSAARKKISRCIHSTQLIFACVLLALPGYICGRTVGAKAFPSLQDARVYAQVKTMSQGERLDTLSKLDEEVWESLTPAQRLSVLQTVADLECARLGLPGRLAVTVAPLEEPVAGSYQDAARTITVSSKALLELDAMENLRIICHETYHAYQYRLVEAYEKLPEADRELAIFRDAAVFAAEFADYSSAEGNPEDYYSQQCESASRRYAEQAVSAYRDEIAVYLAEAIR